jgi:hypothetical protein
MAATHSAASYSAFGSFVMYLPASSRVTSCAFNDAQEASGKSYHLVGGDSPRFRGAPQKRLATSIEVGRARLSQAGPLRPAGSADLYGVPKATD